MSIFSDINEIKLLGNVTKNPEIKYTQGGTAVCKIGVATNHSYKKNDQWEDETTFHNVVLWGKMAEHAEKYLQKGTRIIIMGRIQNRSWDKDDGTKGYMTEVNASRMILIDRYKGKDSQQSAPQSQQMEPVDNDTLIDDDDLPF